MRLIIAVDRKERGIELIHHPMRYEIQLNASNLKNVAGAFKGISDPYATVTLASTDEELGRTVSIKNCLDPKWAEMVYYEHPEFSDGEEKDIYVEIRIYDDNRGKSEDALMSKSMVNLTKVINHPQQSLDVDLEEGGMLNVRAVPSQETNAHIIFQMRALDVLNIEKGALGLGRTDPYLEISKKYDCPEIGRPHWQVVYRSEVIHNHLNPFWERSDPINLESFCDGNLDMPLRISLWDYGSKKRRMIGAIYTIAKELLESVAQEGNGDRSKAFDFQSNSVDEGRRMLKKVGDLIILEARIEEF